ncbi:MAG: HAMP domain-containing histidine kinase [Leptolyngbyaceae cyanobacterium RU_5_1]|nr:HAMP domain-containing histidine kinase [Leptolyngbyaceae cyanobacterium RU_5_1]
MSQPCAPLQVDLQSFQQLHSENAELQRYLDAQKKVIASLERRVGRSLESLGVHMNRLPAALHTSSEWQGCLSSVQSEVDSLCDLLSDAMLLQKLEAGKVDVHLESIPLEPILIAASRHLLDSKSTRPTRLICEFDTLASLPPILADHELTEAVLTDLIARSLKYSDADLPVVVGINQVDEFVHIYVTAQRFAPAAIATLLLK